MLTPALLVANLFCAVALGETSGNLRLTLNSGWDSNARRDYEQTGTVSDGAISVIGVGNIAWWNERWRATGQYEVGGRKFLRYNSEDTLIQTITIQTIARLTKAWAVGIDGRVKDRRGGNRDYSDFLGAAFVEFSPEPSVVAKIRLAAHRFEYRPAFVFSYSAPEVDGEAAYSFDRRHSAYVYGNLGDRRYTDVASGRVDPSTNLAPTLGRRRDTAWALGAGYRYRGPFQLNGSYTYFDDTSNSFGQTFSRHRVTVGVGLPLPARWLALAQVAAQFSRYSDGIFLSPQIVLVEDAENSNSLSLKLVRPLADHWDFEAGYAGYYNRLPQNDLTYWRHYGWVGLTWRL